MPTTSIIEDTRNKVGCHSRKNEFWSEAGVSVFRSKLAVGDYCMPPSVCVDSKASIQELAMDIDHEHERFRNELIKSRDMGTKLVVLVENEYGIRDISDLSRWIEPDSDFKKRKHAVRRIDGARLAKACATMGRRYGARFEFCSPEEAGARVLEILKGEASGRGDA